MNPYLAIFVGGLIPMVVGYIYYHPKLFGTAWMNSLGVTEETLREGPVGLIMMISTVISMVISWRMNAYAGHSEPGWGQFMHGFFHGAWSMGFPAVLILISNGLFQRNTFTNLLINALYWLLALGLMGAFLYSVATPEVASGG